MKLSFCARQVCEELMTRCLAPDCQMGGLGCDNMTVLIICFLHGGSYQDLMERCARPAAPAASLPNSHDLENATTPEIK